jgi:aryl-alcohol dehydrogenase-like predicted oxidoreductase
MIMGTLTDEPTSFRMLDRYTGAGGNFLDTANCYCWWAGPDRTGAESEELLGRWFARSGRRDDVFLATKGAGMVNPRDDLFTGGSGGEANWDLARSRYEGAGAETLRRAIEESLRRMRTDHVDLYYVHVDDRATPLEETLAALDEIVRAGKARYIGWSNVRTWRLERIRQLCAQHGWAAPVALQQQHSYLRRRAGLEHSSIVDDEQMDYLRTHDDLTLVAYSPILKGIYDSASKREGHWAMAPYEGPDAEARLAAATEVAAQAGLTPNQVVLAWLMASQAPRIIPLIGPRTLEQYEAALPALDAKLTDDQLRRLDAAGA